MKREDSSGFWDAGRGIAFSAEKIIAKHIEQTIKDASEKTSSNHSIKDFSSVIAVPDQLDEFGREAILKALPNNISEKVMFLWRPIAATLAWLDKFRNDISTQNSEDWVLVNYLGPDGIEFTPLRLRTKTHKGTDYIVPLRDRPTREPGPTGIDWQANIIEELCEVSEDDPGAFWQVFTNFPELWLSLSQSPWNQNELPRPWSKRGAWSLWMPDEEVSNKIWSVKVKESEIFKRLLKANYKRTQKLRRGVGSTWGSYLKDEFCSALEKGPKEGNLLGLIVCGPLAPSKTPPWIAESLSILKEKGLTIEEPYNQSRKLWLDHSHESIALGAKIFGHRIQNKQPTYFDTRPGLSIYAYTRQTKNIEWINLIDPGEQEGGTLYNKSIKRKFVLNNNEFTLDVYLQKEDMSWNLGHSSIRKGIINFKPVEHGEAKVDINVEMRPTKGMAKIELVPSYKKLGKRSLEYSIMQPIKEEDLPQLIQAFPEIIKIETTPDPMAFEPTRVFETFFEEEISSIEDTPSYIVKLGYAKTNLTSNWGTNVDGRFKYLDKIDPDGKAGSEKGQQIIGKIRLKLNRDFPKILSDVSQSTRDIAKIITRGTWLWGESPSSMVEYLENFFNQDHTGSYGQQWNNFVDAASRCFLNPVSYKCLFASIRSRIEDNRVRNRFPVQSSRAIVKILKFRPDGTDGLDSQTANLFVKTAIQNVEAEINRSDFLRLRNRHKLWQAILLFFVLMRFRINQDNFLDAYEDKDKFDKVFKCLEKAYQKTKDHRFLEWRNNIREYQHKRGTPGLIHALVDLAESERENTED